LLLYKLSSQITKLQYFLWTKIFKNSPLCTSLLPFLLQLQNQVQKCQKKCHKCKYCESIITTWWESSCSEKKNNKYIIQKFTKALKKQEGLKQLLGCSESIVFFKSSRRWEEECGPLKKVADDKTSWKGNNFEKRPLFLEHWPFLFHQGFIFTYDIIFISHT
jgi:hypothetical protein